ncbi:MAG: hypothetical protein ACLPOO_19075 [Terriglobales bacterium]
MKSKLLGRAVLCAAALACGSMASRAAAQDASYNGGAVTQQRPKPLFVTLPPHQVPGVEQPPAVTLKIWSGSFKSGNTTYNFKMVGRSPALSNTTTNIEFFLIPIKIVCDGNTYDPETVQSDGATAVDLVRASPIFEALDYTQGGTNLGTTQYVDAFQRGNFYKALRKNPDYHTLLSPVTMLTERTLSVPSADCSIGNPFGFGNVAIVDMTYFDSQLTTLIGKLSQITPAAVVMGMTYNTYLSANSGISGCCIGGYHSAFGTAPQTYGEFTYIPDVNQYSQDVSALSAEMGDWMDDPFVDNVTEVQGSCSGLLEVAPPTNVLRNFGDFPYTGANGFTYHLQDLAFLDFWSGNPGLQVNGWYSFQNELSGQCSQ